jgi:hypothetical protein
MKKKLAERIDPKAVRAGQSLLVAMYQVTPKSQNWEEDVGSTTAATL